MRIPVFLMLAIASSTATTSLAQNKSTQVPSTALTQWMDLHSRMVRATRGISHVAYSRHFSYTAIAVYESIRGIEPSYHSLSGQLSGLRDLPEIPQKSLYWPASLNAAYADMLRNFYGSFGTCKKTIDSMEESQKRALLHVGARPSLIDRSAGFGKSIAAAIIKWASEDGPTTKKEYIPLTGEGVWTPTGQAAAPFWSENRSLTKNLESIFTLKEPMYSADTTKGFGKMAMEVYNVSVSLTPEEKATALYWDDSPNGQYVTVFGHWTSILSGLIKENRFPLIKAAEAYARMAMSMHEASLLAWKGKYQFNVVRPITFIQQYINPQWKPLISTPPHPEFPAAHATLSNAAAVALCSLFGDNCKVTDNSYIDIGMPQRSYLSLQDVAREAGLSRLYGGIHYRYSIEQGFILGEATAKHIDQSIRFHSQNPLTVR